MENTYNAEDIKGWDETLQNVLTKQKKLDEAPLDPTTPGIEFITAGALIKTIDGQFLFERRGKNAPTNP